jgi:hypothetical protein
MEGSDRRIVIDGHPDGTVFFVGRFVNDFIHMIVGGDHRFDCPPIFNVGTDAHENKTLPYKVSYCSGKNVTEWQ